jgi:small-conductance mechanosensitive channel
MIVPNGNLISNRVTNWTFSDSQRLIEVPISVAQAADSDHFIEMLKGVAVAHPLVIKDPAPQAWSSIWVLARITLRIGCRFAATWRSPSNLFWQRRIFPFHESR